MPFKSRYALWLLVPPAAVSLPVAFLFLSQVVQLGAGSAALLALLFIIVYGAAALVIRAGIGPSIEALEAAKGDAVSKSITSCLERTKSLSIAAWALAGLVVAIAGTMLLLPTPLGFGYFLVAALIAAFPAATWSYAAGKHQLQLFAANLPHVRYTGDEFRLGRKIAIVFIGTFIVAAAALVELISSKVSTTLEDLAIASQAERFKSVYDAASPAAHPDKALLDALREKATDEYALHLIAPDGTLTSTKDSLTSDEVRDIRRIRTGDSSAFISPHVCRFAQLRDGSILVMSIPWTPYRQIPFRITLYTVIVALFTMLAFGIATYYLARDITTPIRELRALATSMAQGNFDVAPRVFSDDEIGELADSFGETRANLQRLLGRVGGSGATITEGVRVITGGTESLLRQATDQAELTENSSLAVENVRGGISSVLGAAEKVTELTQDASSRSIEMQASSEQVARSMDYLFQSVEKTTSASTEMNASAGEMTRRVENLASISEEVLSFVAEMDSTVTELRGSSEATAEFSRQVREDAEAGGDAVAKTVEGINLQRDLTNETAETLDDLQRSVSEVNRILTVIDEVTNRTNLLALNAAIIAAQAGEHGLGFTVVADEIRQLAERTRGSTKEIGAIIKAVQSGSRNAVTKIHEGVRRVEDNVQLAEEASISLAKIVASASQSYEMATKISAALDEQSKASRHLHEVTSRMSDHISEINRSTREQARGTQLLAQESERVREIAGQVKTATDEQSKTGRGITHALEKISDDARAMRDLLERQLHETDRIADASRVMLDIAQANDAIAREFNATVQSLVMSGREFEAEVSRFKVK